MAEHIDKTQAHFPKLDFIWFLPALLRSKD